MFNFKKSKLDKLIDFIRKSDNKLSKEDKKKIINLIKPTIGISTQKLDTDNLKIGHSKIGGKPDLPKNTKWPELNNSPLVFCAQYNISEFKRYDKENVLPKNGIFYIFIGSNEEGTEFSYNEKDIILLFEENIENIERKEFPNSLKNHFRVEPTKVKYFEYLTLPDDENYKLFYFEENYEDFYFHFYQDTEEYISEELYQDIDNMHQILGEDRAIQSSVVYDFAKNEMNIKSDEEYTEKWNEIIENSKKYKVLLQLDCMDPNTNLEKFGGTGVFYFGITKEYLKNKKFESTKFAFQST